MTKLNSLRRYGSRTVKVHIKRNGSLTERAILLLLRGCVFYRRR